jgi:hypothetical protein
MLDAMTTLAPEGRHVVFEPVPYKALSGTKRAR